MKLFAAYVAGFISALVFAASASTLTITTTASDDARLAPAFGNLLHGSGNATQAEIKAWIIAQVQGVVTNYEHQQADNALPPPATLGAN